MLQVQVHSSLEVEEFQLDRSLGILYRLSFVQF
jgi:hypothetical protein